MSESDPVLPANEQVAERPFTVDGRSWIARLTGSGLAGTGRLGLAPLALVRFYAEGEAEPSCETLLPAGRFEELFEAELVTLLGRARPLRA